MRISIAAVHFDRWPPLETGLRSVMAPQPSDAIVSAFIKIVLLTSSPTTVDYQSDLA